MSKIWPMSNQTDGRFLSTSQYCSLKHRLTQRQPTLCQSKWFIQESHQSTGIPAPEASHCCEVSLGIEFRIFDSQVGGDQRLGVVLSGTCQEQMTRVEASATATERGMVMDSFRHLESHDKGWSSVRSMPTPNQKHMTRFRFDGNAPRPTASELLQCPTKMKRTGPHTLAIGSK